MYNKLLKAYLGRQHLIALPRACLHTVFSVINKSLALRIYILMTSL